MINRGTREIRRGEFSIENGERTIDLGITHIQNAHHLILYGRENLKKTMAPEEILKWLNVIEQHQKRLSRGRGYVREGRAHVSRGKRMVRDGKKMVRYGERTMFRVH